MSEELALATMRSVRAHANKGNVAAQTELARRLARNNKHSEALRWFRSAAASGEPERQMELGIVLFWDHAAHREGFKWIGRAAQQDHIGAQYFLAAELATGVVVRKNVKRAARWYYRAAMNGHTEAQYNLALMYWSGEGVQRNVAATHRWVKKAARSNDLLALKALADAFSAGQLGFRRNRIRAAYWRRRYDRVNQIAISSS